MGCILHSIGSSDTRGGANRQGVLIIMKVKSNSIVTHEVTEAGMILFQVKDAGAFTFDPAKASASIMKRAAIHGFIQRISDGAATGKRDEKTGVAFTAGDKFDRMQRIAEHMESGTDNWNLVVASGGQTEGGLVILAIVRAKLAEDVNSADQLVTRLMAKRGIERKDALNVWSSTGKVAEALAAIRAERAMMKAKSADVSAEDLLAEMEGEEEGEDLEDLEEEAKF